VDTELSDTERYSSVLNSHRYVPKEITERAKHVILAFGT